MQIVVEVLWLGIFAINFSLTRACRPWVLNCPQVLHYFSQFFTNTGGGAKKTPHLADIYTGPPGPPYYIYTIHLIYLVSNIAGQPRARRHPSTFLWRPGFPKIRLFRKKHQKVSKIPDLGVAIGGGGGATRRCAALNTIFLVTAFLCFIARCHSRLLL